MLFFFKVREECAAWRKKTENGPVCERPDAVVAVEGTPASFFFARDPEF